MPSLADRQHLVGFFSYSRNDDEGDDGAVSALANRIYRELRAQLGRNAENFKMWRDKDALAAGEHWKEKLKEAVSESVFFIMLVSPSAFNSDFCRYEFDSFIERERHLDRDDLVFPILYISVPELEAKPEARGSLGHPGYHPSNAELLKNRVVSRRRLARGKRKRCNAPKQ